MLFKDIDPEVLKEAIRPWLHGGAKVVSEGLNEEFKAQLSDKVGTHNVVIHGKCARCCLVLLVRHLLCLLFL
jgi:hypothetical protein